MKKYFVIITILLSASLLLTGCNLKEEYSVQYSLINDSGTVTKVEPTPDGLKLEIPFADFTCDAASVKAVLRRAENSFMMTLSGNETIERCGQIFLAQISGIRPGDYDLKVIYLKGAESQPVLFEKFTVVK